MSEMFRLRNIKRFLIKHHATLKNYAVRFALWTEMASLSGSVVTPLHVVAVASIG
jgi:hypothetical protein